MEVDPDVLAAIRKIIDRFLRLGKGTPVHEVRAKLGPKRHVLDDLTRELIIQRVGANYLPRLRAINEFEDAGIQKICFGSTETVLRAFKWICEDQAEKDCTREQIADIIARIFEIPPEAETITIGMLFATEFSNYSSSSSWDSEGGISSIRVTEGIVDFENIGPAWQRELESRREVATRVKAVCSGKGSCYR